MNKSDSEYIRGWANKIRAISLIGGCCKKCGNTNIFQLDFHHINKDDKEKGVGRLRHSRWSVIKEEAKKCELLCRNCHCIEHYDRINPIKDKLLDLKQEKECSICGFKDATCSLDFHHRDPNEKSFRVSRGYRDDRFKIDLETIILEMDKCDVICRNCHALHTTDIDRFNKFKKQIHDKVINFKERQIPVDVAMVKEMIRKGKRVCDIAKILGYARSTISEASRR